jgi:hypothetical protein
MLKSTRDKSSVIVNRDKFELFRRILPGAMEVFVDLH